MLFTKQKNPTSDFVLQIDAMRNVAYTFDGRLPYEDVGNS